MNERSVQRVNAHEERSAQPNHTRSSVQASERHIHFSERFWAWNQGKLGAHKALIKGVALNNLSVALNLGSARKHSTKGALGALKEGNVVLERGAPKKGTRAPRRMPKSHVQQSERHVHKSELFCDSWPRKHAHPSASQGKARSKEAAFGKINVTFTRVNVFEEREPPTSQGNTKEQRSHLERDVQIMNARGIVEHT